MDVTNNPTSQASGPIIAGNCVKCSGMVRIPQTTLVNATVRCPHCHEMFALAELLEQSIPAIEVVASPSPNSGNVGGFSEDAPYIDSLHVKRQMREENPVPERPRTKFEIPKALKEGAKRKRRRRRSRTSQSSSSDPVAPATENPKSKSRSSGSESSRGGSSSRRSSRRSREPEGAVLDLAPYRGQVKSRSSQSGNAAYTPAEVLKLTAAAILAIPVAYLMLFWVFKSDPLGIAGPVSQVLPFVVPASLHPDAAEKSIPELLPAAVSSPDFERQVAYPDANPLDGGGSEPDFQLEASPKIPIPDIDPNEVFGNDIDF